VRIRHAEDLRVYRPGTKALLRGLAYQGDQRTAFLWAQGFIPRLWTYPGREVPKGLLTRSSATNLASTCPTTFWPE
jgi:hypothetical protein